jgi:hypothetical protein
MQTTLCDGSVWREEWKGERHMATEMTGEVVGKHFEPPPGAPPMYWCYLDVRTDEGKPVQIRISRRLRKTIIVGNRVRFKKPLLRNTTVRKVDVLS